MDRQEATETSPLLAKPSSTDSEPSRDISAAGYQNGDTKAAQDEENQNTDEDRGHQYEGMPDVKAKLWSIVPAVGLGVRPSALLR